MNVSITASTGGPARPCLRCHQPPPTSRLASRHANLLQRPVGRDRTGAAVGLRDRGEGLPQRSPPRPAHGTDRPARHKHSVPTHRGGQRSPQAPGEWFDPAPPPHTTRQRSPRLRPNRTAPPDHRLRSGPTTSKLISLNVPSTGGRGRSDKSRIKQPASRPPPRSFTSPGRPCNLPPTSQVSTLYVLPAQRERPPCT